MTALAQRGPGILYGAAVAALLAAAAWSWLNYQAGSDALSSMTRLTARLAFLLFFVTFTTSVWLTWRATPLTRWLMRQRRHLGLSFALVHFTHLAVLSSLFVALGAAPDLLTIVGGGLAYLLLAALVATSNRAARVRLGRGWRVLHLTGCWYLWLIFFQSYAGRVAPAAEAEPYAVYVVLTLLALAVPVLRTWAWLRRRARVRVPAADAMAS